MRYATGSVRSSRFGAETTVFWQPTFGTSARLRFSRHTFPGRTPLLRSESPDSYSADRAHRALRPVFKNKLLSRLRNKYHTYKYHQKQDHVYNSVTYMSYIYFTLSRVALVYMRRSRWHCMPAEPGGRCCLSLRPIPVRIWKFGGSTPVDSHAGGAEFSKREALELFQSGDSYHVNSGYYRLQGFVCTYRCM